MNPSAWNKIASKSKGTSVSHLHEWGEILEEIHGHKIYFLNNKNTIFPIGHVRSRLFGNRLISMPFSDYGGPVSIDSDSLGNIMQELEEISENIQPDFIEIRAPLEEYYDFFITNGYKMRVDYCTFIIPLEKNINEIWNALELRTQRGINRSKKKGLSEKKAETNEDLIDFYSMYLKTMKRLGSPPHPFSFFRALWSEFAKRDIMQIYFAVFDSKPIAAVLFFIHGNKIHYSYGCSLYKYRTKRANDFLFWNAILRFSQEGFKEFDFGRTRHHSGVYMYKKGWGGKKVKLPYFYKFLNKQLEERQEMKHKKLSELWGKYLPVTISNKFGPWIKKQIG